MGEKNPRVERPRVGAGRGVSRLFNFGRIGELVEEVRNSGREDAIALVSVERDLRYGWSMKYVSNSSVDSSSSPSSSWRGSSSVMRSLSRRQCVEQGVSGMLGDKVEEDEASEMDSIELVDSLRLPLLGARTGEEAELGLARICVRDKVDPSDDESRLKRRDGGVGVGPEGSAKWRGRDERADCHARIAEVFVEAWA